WTADGNDIVGEDDAQLILSEHNLLPGQSISCTYTVTDNTGLEVSNSISEEIQNRNPVINGDVEISGTVNGNVAELTTLTCEVTEDPSDEDNEDLTSTYSWYTSPNDVEPLSTEQTLIISENKSVEWGTIYCVLTVSDNSGAFTPKPSSTFTITPPVFADFNVDYFSTHIQNNEIALNNEVSCMLEDPDESNGSVNGVPLTNYNITWYGQSEGSDPQVLENTSSFSMGGDDGLSLTAGELGIGSTIFCEVEGTFEFNGNTYTYSTQAQNGTITVIEPECDSEGVDIDLDEMIPIPEITCTQDDNLCATDGYIWSLPEDSSSDVAFCPYESTGEAGANQIFYYLAEEEFHETAQLEFGFSAYSSSYNISAFNEDGLVDLYDGNTSDTTLSFESETYGSFFTSAQDQPLYIVVTPTGLPNEDWEYSYAIERYDDVIECAPVNQDPDAPEMLSIATEGMFETTYCQFESFDPDEPSNELHFSLNTDDLSSNHDSFTFYLEGQGIPYTVVVYQDVFDGERENENNFFEIGTFESGEFTIRPADNSSEFDFYIYPATDSEEYSFQLYRIADSNSFVDNNCIGDSGATYPFLVSLDEGSETHFLVSDEYLNNETPLWARIDEGPINSALVFYVDNRSDEIRIEVLDHNCNAIDLSSNNMTQQNLIVQDGYDASASTFAGSSATFFKIYTNNEPEGATLDFTISGSDDSSPEINECGLISLDELPFNTETTRTLESSSDLYGFDLNSGSIDGTALPLQFEMDVSAGSINVGLMDEDCEAITSINLMNDVPFFFQEVPQNGSLTAESISLNPPRYLVISEGPNSVGGSFTFTTEVRQEYCFHTPEIDSALDYPIEEEIWAHELQVCADLLLQLEDVHDGPIEITIELLSGSTEFYLQDENQSNLLTQTINEEGEYSFVYNGDTSPEYIYFVDQSGNGATLNLFVENIPEIEECTPDVFDEIDISGPLDINRYYPNLSLCSDNTSDRFTINNIAATQTVIIDVAVDGLDNPGTLLVELSTDNDQVYATSAEPEYLEGSIVYHLAATFNALPAEDPVLRIEKTADIEAELRYDISVAALTGYNPNGQEYDCANGEDDDGDDDVDFEDDDCSPFISLRSGGTFSECLFNESCDVALDLGYYQGSDDGNHIGFNFMKVAPGTNGGKNKLPDHFTVPAEQTNQIFGITHGLFVADIELTSEQKDLLNAIHTNQEFTYDTLSHLPVSLAWEDAAFLANILTEQTLNVYYNGDVLMDFTCYQCNWGLSNLCVVKEEYQGENIHECAGYRLPTSAEWLHLMRGEANNFSLSQGVRYTGENIYEFGANNAVQSGYDTFPNSNGLYHTLGNVMEWTHDVLVASEYDDQVGTEEDPILNPASESGPTLSTDDGTELVMHSLYGFSYLTNWTDNYYNHYLYATNSYASDICGVRLVRQNPD
ncbi:MAG: hypothetical protein CMK59_08695, partial [Proteobacteria bacterium]|nr:hypothetical protein [Pseudomonadota bacterium]